jgi:hypothetical protein
MNMRSSILRFLGLGTPRDTSEKKTGNVVTEMTAAVIDNIADDKLLKAAYDNICSKFIGDVRGEYELVETLGKCRQAVYVIWQLESAVNNGGFSQFYCNTSGQFAAMMPAALQLVGAHKFSELVSRANDVHRNEQDSAAEAFAKSSDELDDLDQAFFALYQDEDLEQLQVAFIRRHKLEFADR